MAGLCDANILTPWCLVRGKEEWAKGLKIAGQLPNTLASASVPRVNRESASLKLYFLSVLKIQCASLGQRLCTYSFSLKHSFLFLDSKLCTPSDISLYVDSSMKPVPAQIRSDSSMFLSNSP